jgi:predicted TIM-barrel fold metal-dependent hydrolase
MLPDDVAVDFPDLRMVLAHPSFPWQQEALTVANHKPRVWIDLSGWSPKYFPPILVRYANSLLQDKALLKIMKGNAARLLGLTGEDTP